MLVRRVIGGRVLLVCWVMTGIDTLVSWRYRLDCDDYEIGG